MFDEHRALATSDPELCRAIEAENRRQEDHLELIASENYVSPAVLQATGSQLTNKYAEGYPGRRYYGGCEHVDEVERLPLHRGEQAFRGEDAKLPPPSGSEDDDEVERLAIDRAKQLYGAEYANLQPHSGSQANQAVYFSLLRPGDAILGMSLAHGGHLTHGASVSLCGKLLRALGYGLDADELIDYEEVERLARSHRPKLIVAVASAYS